MSEATPYRAIPKQPQAQDRRNRILDEAARLVGSVGQENVTTIDVARASGSSVGAVYRLFPDKHGMLAAVAERHIQQIIAKLPKKKSASAEKLAASIVRVLTDMNRDAPAFRQLNVGEQITCFGGDGWLQIADAVHQRLTVEPLFQPEVTAAALAGADSILAQGPHVPKPVAIRNSFATQLLTNALKGE